jgi:galactokinase
VKNISVSIPGRISLSKHSDYINNDLLYCLDERAVFLDAKLVPSDSEPKIYIKNTSIDFRNYEIELSKAFHADHLNQIKNDWTFYVIYGLKTFLDLYKLKQPNSSLELNFSSTLPPRNGLSSSHAIINCCLKVFAYLYQIKNLTEVYEALEKKHLDQNILKEVLNLALFAQSIESKKGFNSGLGDQLAQLLGRKSLFSFIKIFPKLEISYHKIPAELSILSIPSFIEADKSDPKFFSANENIRLYKEVSKSFLSKFNDHRVNFLGDLLYIYEDRNILEKLLEIKDKRLQGLALYGLAEGARLKKLKESFLANSDEEELLSIQLGRHLNLSHEAEKVYEFNSIESHKKISEERKLNFKIDPRKPLAEHIGIYSASTLANDRLQFLANTLEGVYGSSITGAGLGGSNLVLCKKKFSKKVFNTLYDCAISSSFS